MQLISTFNKVIRFLLFVIDVLSTQVQVVSLKDKEGTAVTNAFIYCSEFNNRSVKSWLQDSDTEMHSTRYEGKSVIAERFIRTVQNKIRKYMTSVLKNKYTNKLDNLVNQHNNTYHNTIQMKPADEKSNTYIEFKENIKEGPNFEVEKIFEKKLKFFLQKVTLQICLKKFL